jgi:hypothetical protein
MNTAKAVASMCMLLLSIGLGWFLLGWWMVAVVVCGLAWHLIRSDDVAPSTTYYKPPSRPTIYPAPTGPTWQETVAKIEAARQFEMTERSSETSHGVTKATHKAPTWAHSVERIAERACIDAAPLLAKAHEISAAAASGSPQELGMLLRTCCPTEAWNWPEAATILQSQGKRGTRLQQVELVADMVQRAHVWSNRLPQMYRRAESRPYWQFRSSGGSREPAECKAINGRTERHDSPFWAQYGPWICERPECGCSVRAFTEIDWQQRQAS